MSIFNQKYLGQFKEERDGVVCIVKKWETVTPLEEHNTFIEQSVSKLEAQKVEERAPMGKVEVAAVEAVG